MNRLIIKKSLLVPFTINPDRVKEAEIEILDQYGRHIDKVQGYFSFFILRVSRDVP